MFTENETEISYFRLEDYLAYKANPRTTWWWESVVPVECSSLCQTVAKTLSWYNFFILV